MPASINLPLPNDGRSYSLSPSTSDTSKSAASSPPATLVPEIMPMAALSLSSSLLPYSMHAYADPSALSTQPYSMVHPSGLRYNSPSSPELSGFRSSRSTGGPSFHSLNISQPVEPQTLQLLGLGRSSAQSRSAIAGADVLFCIVLTFCGSPMSMTNYDRSKARNDIRELFRPLLADSSITATPERHLSTLQSMSDSLPGPLKPTKLQLETPHYYGIDLLASPSLRDRLLTVTSDVAQSFVSEIEDLANEREDAVVIWGDDPLNEMSWEFSQMTLERWGWMLGGDWVQRANFWRRQRGTAMLTDW